jgi:hypothetical protein
VSIGLRARARRGGVLASGGSGERQGWKFGARLHCNEREGVNEI